MSKLNVIVHPNSKRPRTETDLTGTTHIYVREPAIEGKANAQVINVLAEIYKTPKTQIKLLSGMRSKYKVYEIE